MQNPADSIRELGIFWNREKIKAQLKQLDKIDLYEGGTMNVIDVKPEKLKTEIPTFWIYGWGGTVERSEEVITNLALYGRRILSVDTPHGIERANIHETAIEYRQKTHDIELRKVAALLKSLDEKGIGKTDIVAHSEGAIYGVLAALLRPERFRSVVLANPAGMIGEDTVGRLVSGAAWDTYIEVAKIYKKILTKSGVAVLRRSSMGTKSLAKVFALDPRRTIESVEAIAKTQIHEMLRILKKLGIKISIVHAVDDKFFPMKKMGRQTTTEMVDGFYSVRGTHNQLYLYPEQYTFLVDNALDALEALREEE